MKITISDDREIAAIQDEFNQVFPYLRLEFFSTVHKTGAPSAKKQMKSSAKTLGECRTLQNDGTINITPGMTVGDLENEFGEVYGLGVQVFRKSGKVWLETTLTDSWTLEHQNNQGEELSNIRN